MKPKRSFSVTNTLVPCLVALLCLSVCTIYVLTNTPLQTILQKPSETAPENSGTSATTGTTTYYQRWYPPSTSSDWFHVGETVDWNGQYAFVTEDVQASKALPPEFTMDDIYTNRTYRMTEFDEDGTLLSQHIYIVLTLSITKTASDSVTLYGATLLPFGDSTGVGNLDIAFYDLDSGDITTDESLEAYRNLSDDIELDWGGSTTLEIGQTLRVRILYLINEDAWNNGQSAVLLAPYSKIFDADDLRHIGFCQPYILLNEKEIGK